MDKENSGILIVDKEAGMTSRDVVNVVSKKLKTKKIGHTGTLDPMATGVLVITIGKCTKMTEILTSSYKEYVASFRLGFETDTLDMTGEITEKSSKKVDEAEVRSTVRGFIGKYEQEVPKYSAVKKEGKKLYEYARAGVEVELPKREVDIREIELLDYSDEKITFRCVVSKGTYVRSLIRDIGHALGTFATMSALRRTKQGSFTIEDAYSLDEIRDGKFKIISPFDYLEGVSEVDVEKDGDLYKKVINGRKVFSEKKADFIKFVKNGQLLVLYKWDEDCYRMYIKFVDNP